MLKRVIAILVCLSLILTFAACGKDKDNDSSNPSSSNPSSSNPTQDYEKNEFDEGQDLTDEEREELEDLWNDLIENGDVVIETPSTDESSDSNSSESTPSSEDSETGEDENEEKEESNNGVMGDSEVEIQPDVPSIW